MFLALCVTAFALAPACSRKNPGTPTTRAELRSWVVAARGRHLYLNIFIKPDKPVRVEFGSTAQRTDYQPPGNVARAGRIARMTPGVILQPILSTPDNRIEAEYDLTDQQVRSLLRDRVFAAPYSLLGRNSNSAMAAAMRDAGLALPQRVARGGGLLGEFPGINLTPGPDIPIERWPDFGVPNNEPEAPARASTRQP